ncbi:GNAT family N-acetyltransferase [Allorhodopirellula solitaria]|uniref:N-acyltransferase YncA n=1 Tax=Allorhodopirellula solitaria TaxID=2527987 RepID=A0A5C5YEN2_9BACT|nr:GNAT family N-acetyltransferase [Allorhodopirellula solitaria]TWT73389.1 N-acyltransferase YncA [Allorhodopirellula solitaria]
MADSESQIVITPVDPQQDAAEIARIYRYYVLNTFATFEEIPPTCSEMRTRIESSLDGDYPFLVAKIGRKCVGYASTKLFYGRTAFHPSAEDSIFLDPEYCGRGIGRQLLRQLIEECTQRGYLNLIALIGGGSQNQGSIKLHESCGFELVGNLRNVGRKIGRLHDMSTMQLVLPRGHRTVEHVTTPSD